MKNAIEVHGLCKAYPNFQLKNVSFALPQGSIMGLIGENGAGKTTTLKAMLNVISKDSGEIRLLGMDSVTDEKQLHQELGVVFDACHFPGLLTVREIGNVMAPLYTAWDMPFFQSLLKQFELNPRQPVHELSKGMSTKLSLAIALAHHPRLLILDEATSGLDPVIREELLDIFLSFIQDEQHSILLSSHITSDLDRIADYITFLHRGEVVFCQEKDLLLERMGILRCGERDFQSLAAGEVLRFRKNSFGVEALLSDRQTFLRQHPGALVDSPNLEEIMLFYVKGGAL